MKSQGNRAIQHLSAIFHGMLDQEYIAGRLMAQQPGNSPRSIRRIHQQQQPNPPEIVEIVWNLEQARKSLSTSIFFATALDSMEQGRIGRGVQAVRNNHGWRSGGCHHDGSDGSRIFMNDRPVRPVSHRMRHRD